MCASSITWQADSHVRRIRIRTRPYATHATNTKAISATFRITRRIWRYIYSSLRSKYDSRQLNTQTCTHRSPLAALLFLFRFGAADVPLSHTCNSSALFANHGIFISINDKYFLAVMSFFTLMCCSVTIMIRHTRSVHDPCPSRWRWRTLICHPTQPQCVICHTVRSVAHHSGMSIRTESVLYICCSKQSILFAEHKKHTAGGDKMSHTHYMLCWHACTRFRCPR